MDTLIPVTGIWFWWIAAGVLLILELMLPGVFFVWLAAAAAVVGLLDAAFNFGWQIELVLFAIFAVIFLFGGRKFLASRKALQGEMPNLNQRIHDYVGQLHPLEDAIVNGRGKVRIDDTLWEVMGPELAKGARVRVTGVDGMRLKVEQA
ncbi:MAG: NfeD family protein [Rhizobiales bacterium]|nr:NfeD family protein [Hyphomicrobiales bacterium]